MSKPRALLQQFCADVAVPLLPLGFRALQRGQTLRKVSADGDRTFTIFFGASTLNRGSSVTVFPDVTVRSKALAAWWKNEHPSMQPREVVFGANLGEIARSEYEAFKVSKAALAKVSKAITETVLPLFELFATEASALAFLCTHGTRFNRSMKEQSLAPMGYLLARGTEQQAQKFCTLQVRRFRWPTLLAKLRADLRSKKPVNVNFAEFIGADHLKLAHVHGLKV